MHKIIDAKLFFLRPSPSDCKRIEKLITQESSEAFIIDNWKILQDLFLQLDKIILVIDAKTYNGDLTIGDFTSRLLDNCGDKILKIFVVEGPEDTGRDPVIIIDRETSENDLKLLGIIDDLSIWGLRSYIRFGNQKSRIAFFRMKQGDLWRTGVIHDISASGMSCSFDRYEDINVDERSTEIEICIRESIFRLSGNFLIRRTFKNVNTFVIVFGRSRRGNHIERLNSIIYKLIRQQVIEKIEKID